MNDGGNGVDQFTRPADATKAGLKVIAVSKETAAAIESEGPASPEAIVK